MKRLKEEARLLDELRAVHIDHNFGAYEGIDRNVDRNKRGSLPKLITVLFR
jgi:hypothetical protein